MQRLPQVLFCVAAGATLLGAQGTARADVRYTSEMKLADSGAVGGQGSSIRTTTFFKDRRQRVETAMAFGPIKMTTVVLDMCDKDQSVRMDPDLKLYTVGPMGGGAVTPPTGLTPGRAPRREEKPGQGKIVTTYAVQNMGDENIADLMTHHSMITMRMQSSGCIGESDTTMKMEVWVANIRTFDCPERFAASRVVPNEHGCQITMETKGDVDAIRQAYGGMVVRQKFYQGDKAFMTQDLREYSEAALDAALFDVPKDFKQVTAEEFQDAQQKAMIKKLQGGATAPDDSDKPADKAGDQAADNAKPADSGKPAEGDKPTEEKPKKKKIKIPFGLPK